MNPIIWLIEGVCLTILFMWIAIIIGFFFFILPLVKLVGWIQDHWDI